MIQGSNNPFSCTPAVVGLNNQIIELGTISRVDDTFTFSTGFKWMINSQNYENTTTFDYTPAPATTDFKRIDVAVLNQNNEIEFLAGTESDTIALRPTIPINNLLLTQWNINGSTIEDSVDPLIGEAFIKKSFAQPYLFDGSGTNQEIPLDPLGREEIRLTNESLESVKGFNLSLITGVPSAEVPFIGKEIRIRNLTGRDVEFKHSDLTAGLIFLARNNSDVVIPDNEDLIIKYGGGGFYEIDKSWSDGISSGCVYYKMHTLSTTEVTGAGSWEHIESFLAIPSGTLQAGDVIKITVRHNTPTDSGTNFSMQPFIYSSAVSTYASAGYRLMAVSNLSRRYGIGRRNWIKIIDENTFNVFNQGSTIYDDITNGFNSTIQDVDTGSVSLFTDDIYLNLFVNCPNTRTHKMEDVEIMVFRNI